MTIRSKRTFSAIFAVGSVGTLLASGRSAAAQPTGSSACAAIGAHSKDTVIAFEPPSSFTLCRNGDIETDVVAGRPVYVEVLPTTGSSMFEFRVHGRATEVRPTGLGAWQREVSRIARGLHELERSREPISTVKLPGEASPASPLRSVIVARELYAGVATPRFLEVLAGLHADLHALPSAAAVVRRWCGEMRDAPAASPAMAADLRARCAAPDLAGNKLDRDVADFSAADAAFDAARSLARVALVAAAAQSDDADVIAKAARALDLARADAEVIIAKAGSLARLAEGLAEAARDLRDAIGSTDALRIGVPSYLATYSSGGNGQLEIDAHPLGVGADDEQADDAKESTTLTFDFPIVGTHYFDLEAGVGVTGGLPSVPTVATQNGQVVLQGKPVDEFLALALVELEPLRFPWPDRPLAGLLRFPVIGVPLTRDPTQNFLVGGGIGWTGIGSITAGPYFLRELTLRNGQTLGEVVPVGTSVDDLTHPTVQVGYFVSASVDLVGLFRLFVPEHLPTIDAASGKDR